MRESLSANASEKDKLLLCLPDIAAAVAERQTTAEDRQGWLYLREMFLKWFAGVANEDPDTGGEPYWIDWNWFVSFPRGRSVYENFISPPRVAGAVCSDAALRQLAEIVCCNVDFGSSSTATFNFIDTHWSEWERLYHNQAMVPRGSNPDGLYAALAGCNLRVLAKGTATKGVGGQLQITVDAMAVFARDSFNFEEIGTGGTSIENYLGAWSCELGDYVIITRDPYVELYNSDFNKFRASHGYGNNFLVLSKPHLVEGFERISYEAVCVKTTSDGKCSWQCSLGSVSVLR